MKVNHIHNSSHSKLTDYCGQPLRFDFLIENENYKPIVIEYNGEQHYRPVTFGKNSQEKAEENFKKQKEHDNIKREFCKKYDYNLLEIHYKDYGDINKIISGYLIENLGWGFEEEK